MELITNTYQDHVREICWAQFARKIEAQTPKEKTKELQRRKSSGKSPL